MFSDFITYVGFFLILSAPLLIQWILFPIAKLCFKKAPSHKIYSVCLAVNTVLLFMLKEMYLNSQNPNEMEPMDAFDGIIIMALWSPWYIVILISCIIRIITAKKSDITENKESL